MKSRVFISIAYGVAGGVGFLIAAGGAQGADFTAHPSLAVSEEFTDNVFETDTGRVSDFITRAMPGIALTSKSPALDANLNYFYDYRYYARRTRGTDQTHDLSANAHLTAVNNLLFFDVSDLYRRVSLDVTRDVTKESLFVNQEDRNVLMASPYVTLHPGQRTMVTTGYRFTDIRYFDSSQGVDKTDHGGFVEGSYQISQEWYATGGYAFLHENNSVDDFDRHLPYIGFRYAYGGSTSAASTTQTSASVTPFVSSTAENPPVASMHDISDVSGSQSDISFLFGQLGYTWIKYGSGNRFNNVYWNVGASHAFAAGTVTVTTGVKYDEDPLNTIMQESFVTGNVEKHLKKGSIGVSLYYSEFAQAMTDTTETRKYGGTVRGRYDFTSRLNGNLSFNTEKYDQRQLNTYTRRFLVDSSLGYLLADQFTVSLNYIFVDYYSPAIETDNKQVNRAILELRKVF